MSKHEVGVSAYEYGRAVDALKRAEARAEAAEALAERLAHEIGLTHERLDELDQKRPLYDFVPDLVMDFFHRADKAEAELATLRLDRVSGRDRVRAVQGDPRPEESE